MKVIRYSLNAIVFRIPFLEKGITTKKEDNKE